MIITVAIYMLILLLQIKYCYINKKVKNMFKLIIELLNTDNFYGVSKNIDIAKGLKEIPSTNKDAFIQLKRIVKSRKYKLN